MSQNKESLTKKSHIYTDDDSNIIENTSIPDLELLEINHFRVINFHEYNAIQISQNDKWRNFTDEELESLIISIKKLESKSLQNFVIKEFDIPKRLLRFNFYSYNHFTWYLPPSERTVWFKTKYKYLNGAHKIKFPTIVFQLVGNNVSVAMADEDNPTLESKLYMSPFFNVSGLEVCSGNQNFKKLKTFKNISMFLKHHEDIFFESPFTHSSGNTVKGFETLELYWKHVVKTKEVLITDLNEFKI